MDDNNTLHKDSLGNVSGGFDASVGLDSIGSEAQILVCPHCGYSFSPPNAFFNHVPNCPLKPR